MGDSNKASPMEFAQLKEFIDLLVTRTKSKNAIWNRGSGSDSYQIVIGTGSVTIDRYDDDYGNVETFTFNIFNENGDLIDSYSASNAGMDDTIKVYQLLKNLHDEARRCFYKIDETLLSFMEELKKPGTIGKQMEPPKQEKKSDDLPF